jgi:hypothetical protein
LINEGETRTLFRERGLEVVGIEEELVCNGEVPLLTIILVEEEFGDKEEMLLKPWDMCEEALVSKNQSSAD